MLPGQVVFQQCSENFTHNLLVKLSTQTSLSLVELHVIYCVAVWRTIGTSSADALSSNNGRLTRVHFWCYRSQDAIS